MEYSASLRFLPKGLHSFSVLRRNRFEIDDVVMKVA